jgi:hypothetical protein
MKNVLFLVIFSIIFFSESLFCQVGIYPQAIFLDIKNRSGSMSINNSTNTPKEVSIDIKFGYPTYDTLGISKMIYGDTIPEAKYSIFPYVKVFPKKLILKANEEQTVRFILGNISNLEDGTYFGRIFVTSKEPDKEIDSTINKDSISTKFEIVYTLISAIFLQKGQKNCNIKINNAKIYSDSANTLIAFDFKRSGNSPFLGTTHIIVLDEVGNEIQTLKESTPVYFDMIKPFKFDKNKFKPGKYEVKINMSNEHKDIPKDFKIPFESLKASFIVYLEKN